MLSCFPFPALGGCWEVEGCTAREGQSREWELIAFPTGSGEIMVFYHCFKSVTISG